MGMDRPSRSAPDRGMAESESDLACVRDDDPDGAADRGRRALAVASRLEAAGPRKTRA